MKNKIQSLLLSAGVLFAAACADDSSLGDASVNKVSGDEVTVTFTVSAEGHTAVTRADSESESRGNLVYYPNDDLGEYAQISDGTKAKLLVYAVYNSEKQLLEQYSEGVINYTKDATTYTPAKGQTAIIVKEFPLNGEKAISLRLMRNQSYYIAFWAQSIDSEAFDISDLTKVRVKYKDEQGNGMANNDELRDAFCHTEYFTVSGEDGTSREVILTRPLAQINVGTAGYDFELVASDEEKEKWLYSKISIEGVSEYFDVVSNQVLITEEDFASHDLADKYGENGLVTVEYDWARFPAYINYNVDDDELLANKIDDEGKEVPYSSPYFKAGLATDGNFRTAQEQFLRVDLNGDGRYAPYVSFDKYNEEKYRKAKEVDGELEVLPPYTERVYTEEFKYLSMCYVLVPSRLTPTEQQKDPDDAKALLDGDEETTPGDHTHDDKDKGYGNPNNAEKYGTTVSKVNVWVGYYKTVTDENGTETKTMEQKQVIENLQHVPVQNNWRTNIVGNNLFSIEKAYLLDVKPEYNGEYNYDGTDNGNDKWNRKESGETL